MVGDSAPVQPPVQGCTDSLAENYMPDAVLDDGYVDYPSNGEFSLSFDGDLNSVNIDVVLLETILFQMKSRFYFLCSQNAVDDQLFMII